jgi:hypothetical protein
VDTVVFQTLSDVIKFRQGPFALLTGKGHFTLRRSSRVESKKESPRTSALSARPATAPFGKKAFALPFSAFSRLERPGLPQSVARGKGKKIANETKKVKKGRPMEASRRRCWGGPARLCVAAYFFARMRARQ